MATYSIIAKLYVLTTFMSMISYRLAFHLSLGWKRNFIFSANRLTNDDENRALKQVYNRKLLDNNTETASEVVNELKEVRELSFFYLRDVLKIKDKTLSRIVSTYPFILYYRPDTNLRPTIEAFKSFGFKISDIRHIVEACPTILGLNAAWTIPEKLITIQKLFSLNRQSLVNVVTKSPYLITSSIDRNIAIASFFTDEICMSQNEIRTMMSTYPQVAMTKFDDLRDCWNLLINKFGFTEKAAKSLIVKNSYIMSKRFSKGIDKRVKFFNDELNLLPPFEDLQKLILSNPALLIFDVDFFLKPNINLLKRYLSIDTKLTSKIVTYQPYILCYNPATLEKNINNVLFLLTGCREYHHSYNNCVNTENISYPDKHINPALFEKNIFETIEHVFSNASIEMSENFYNYENDYVSDSIEDYNVNIGLFDSIELNEENEIYSLPIVKTFQLSDDNSIDVYDDLTALRRDAEAFDEYEKNIVLIETKALSNKNITSNISPTVNSIHFPLKVLKPSELLQLDSISSSSNSLLVDGDTFSLELEEESAPKAWGKKFKPLVNTTNKSSFMCLDLISDIALLKPYNNYNASGISSFDLFQNIPYNGSFSPFSQGTLHTNIPDYDKAMLHSVKFILLSCTCLDLSEEVAKKAIRIFSPLLAYRSLRCQQMVWSLALSLGMNRNEISKIVAMYPRLFSVPVEGRLTRLLRLLASFAIYYLDFKKNVAVSSNTSSIASTETDNVLDDLFITYESTDSGNVTIVVDHLHAQKIDLENDDWIEFLKSSNPGKTEIYNIDDIDISIQQALKERRNNLIRKMVRSIICRYPLIAGTNIERIENRLEEVYANKEIMNVFHWDKLITLIRRTDDKHKKYIDEILHGKKKVVQLEIQKSQKRRKNSSTKKSLYSESISHSVLLDDGLLKDNDIDKDYSNMNTFSHHRNISLPSLYSAVTVTNETDIIYSKSVKKNATVKRKGESSTQKVENIIVDKISKTITTTKKRKIVAESLFLIDDNDDEYTSKVELTQKPHVTEKKSKRTIFKLSATNKSN